MEIPIQQEGTMGKFYGPKYGRRAYQNINWTYDIVPLIKWALLIVTACLFATMTVYLLNVKKENEQKILINIEAYEVEKRYFENRLEVIKQETIAAEQKRIYEQKMKEEIEKSIIKSPPTKGPKIYSWTNENGQKVFSNQPPK